jgi:flagellar biosynthetic protein FlhB
VAEDDDKESKTESPTAKRMTDAAEKGNLPFSREITAFASTVAVYLYFIYFARDGIARVTETLRDLFEKPEQWPIDNSNDLIALFMRLGADSASLVLPALLLMMSFGIMSSILQHMPSFVLERISPKMSHISLSAGLGRMFGKPGLVEFAKAMVKVVLVGIVVSIALYNAYFASLDTMFSGPDTLLVKMYADIRTILIIVLFATALVGIGDFFWTRYKWVSDLRMTKQEVKDENKQAEGDPIVKARQRSIARDRMRKQMIAAVPRATLVIANPTHFAVALRYVRDETDAPIVIAKGQDLIALKIREIAESNGIPVFEDPPLARSMFAQVSVDSVIPSVFYKAVAELIHRVYAARSQTKRINQAS